MKTLEQRFWSKVHKTKTCWFWTGTCGTRGYGELSVGGRKGRKHGSHRISWFIHTGKWPKQDILHSCDTPQCVNPAHLMDGDAKENAMDAAAKGNCPRMYLYLAKKCKRGHRKFNPGRCHECIKIRDRMLHKKYREKNRERYNAYQREWRKKNREHHNAWQRERYAKMTALMREKNPPLTT